jgi:hypothetical protein
MRIAKATLNRSWLWSSTLAVLVFAVLAWLDYRLKALTAVGTFDLSGLSGPVQFQAAFIVWRTEPLAARAGFNLGLDYLLMPLYAASFFYSGIVAAEGLAPRPGTVRRVLMAAIWVPVVGAAANACENALYLLMLVGGVDQTLVLLAGAAGRVKTVALFVGLLLFLGAVMARYQERRKRAQASDSKLGFGDKP